METQSVIRVKSLAWIKDQGRLFVVKMADKVKRDHYYRPVGGNVEFGELAIDTVRREVMEELNTEVEVTGLPMIVENRFTCDGVEGHEIDYFYPCKFKDEYFFEQRTHQLIEADGSNWEAMWIPITDRLNGSLRLVPDALLDWYRQVQRQENGKPS